MSYQHSNLAAGQWDKLSFAEQMANAGSEVIRASKWKTKKNPEYCLKAATRALELLDLTLQSVKTFPRLKEVSRVREVVADYFFGQNEYGSAPKSLENYFLAFNFLARKNIS